jgi:hypothetical protein
MSPVDAITAASSIPIRVPLTAVRYRAVRWKLVGLAGLLGAVAVGAVAVNRRRARTWNEYHPDELRERLHARLRSAT